ncbi:MAG: Rdx family protein [Alphaproteobacteria bacterium]|nr:Rdx family protein [Alphaproteobacteria bacterium]
MVEKYGVEVEIVSGARTSFEIIADGETLYSKLATGRFPEDGEVTTLLDD